MTVVIGQRELRNDNAEIMRRVEAGESFVITRHGSPVADLVPHDPHERSEARRKLGDIQRQYRRARPIDSQAWRAERAGDDEVFGPDDPLTDEWSRRPGDRPSN